MATNMGKAGHSMGSIALVIFLGLLVVCAVPLRFTFIHAVYEAINLSQNDSASVFPQLFVSDNDDIHVVWQDVEPGENDIYISSSTDGGDNFGERIDISNTELASSNAQVAASGNDVYVTWQDATLGTTDILFSTSTDSGETFETPINISDNELASSLPQIALSTSGTIYVVWQDLTPGNSEILFSSSTDGGATFGIPISISNTEETSNNAKIVATGETTLYVVWQDGHSGTTDIYISTSTDGGSTFGTPVNISDNEGGSTAPQIAASSSGDGNDQVHVIWQDQTPGNQDIFAAASTDGGSTFGAPINVSNMEAASQSPRLAIDSDDPETIHIVWHDSVSGTSDIYISTSTDGGSTFGTPINVSDTADNISTNGRVAVFDSDNVFVAWQELTDDNGNEIFFKSSTDGGSSFGTSLDLSNTPDGSTNLQMGLSSDGGLYVVWQDATFGGSDTLIQSNFDSSVPTISIDQVTSESPKWGSMIEASGTVTNEDDGDTVRIIWGDGTSSTDIPISGSTWGPVDHMYDQSAVVSSPNLMVAELISADAAVKAASSAIEINVLRHATKLDLTPIPSVKQGEDILVSGSLVDLDDDNSGIGGKLINFSGSGAVNLASTSTGLGDGSFSTSGASPSSAEDSWMLQAFFDGSLDSLYESGESEIKTYDTAESSANAYEVEEGDGINVNITGFDFKASVDFENVVSAGLLYVSLCETPEGEEKFIPLSPIEACLRISPGIIMGEESQANVTLSFVNADLPDGFDASVVSIFHDDALEDDFIDVTKARNLDEETVTGTVTTFSEFVAGLSLHEEKPQGSHREQIFVGDGNQISLRNINDLTNSSASVTATFDDSSYRRGDHPILTIADSGGNVDAAEADIIKAGVMSESSDPIAITITLEETGANTAIFEGSFGLGFETSDLTDTLEADPGDKLSAFYISGARFSATIDGVTEAGLAEMNDIIVDSSVCFRPIGGAVEVKLIDAQLGEDGKITATMSYRNAIFQPGDEFELLDFFYRQDSSWDRIEDVTVNENEMTLTAETPGVGGFSLGYDTGCGGGSGGGLGRPGTGIALDFLASIAISSGSGGHQTSGPTSTENTNFSPSISSGESVSSKVDIKDSEIDVNLLFDNVVVGGTISVKTNDPSDLASLFDTLRSEGLPSSHGLVEVDGTNSTTIGDVYDVSTSLGFLFEGNVIVTIPYEESTVLQSGASESHIRLLHYNGSKWEDMTISLDTVSNTVTGQLVSLSPVVAAVLEDGTFGEVHLELHPLDGILVKDASFVTRPMEATIGGVVNVSATVTNLHRSSQSYAFVVQIEDESGISVYIDWTTGSLLRGETTEIGINWAPTATGNYSAKIMILDKDPISSEILMPIAYKMSVTPQLTDEET